MKNKEYLEFLIGRKLPSEALKTLTKKDITLSFRKNEIILKFLGFQILGALFSMAVCPQFGVGLVQGHGITHNFRMIGDWACAAFCGTLFLTSGMLVAFIGMKGEELWWVWRRYKISLIVLPALLWGGLMLTNITMDLPEETPSYHLTWIAMAVLAEALWFQFRSNYFVKGLAESKSS
jgi:hypothetical protein